ncbi:MAG: hypothetical protein ACLGXA_22540 [Acidobacteriota bacterium]
MTWTGKIAWLAVAALMSYGAAGEDGGSADKNAAERAVVSTRAFEPAFGAGVTRTLIAADSDPCDTADLTATPSRPVWTAGAQTTQCGVLETDYGWLWQGLGGGFRQTAAAMSMRYGVTPRLDLRWGVPAHLTQSGGGAPALQGVSDQSLSLTYRFAEQSSRLPAMALGYGFKIPTANPAKGFGTGFVDHQLAFIASRDVRKLHFDFNTAGILAGSPRGYDGAAQYGLVLSVPATKQWMFVETDGGSLPGIADRFGQALAGVQWSVRPWLVIDTAYTRAYTAGLPRQQFTVGWTWSTRPAPVVMARQRLARLLGRR